MYFEHVNKEIDKLLDKLPTLPLPSEGFEFFDTLIKLLQEMKHKQDWLEKELDKLNEQ